MHIFLYQVEYKITVQMLEIYNENLRDLLNGDRSAPNRLDILSTQASGCNVPGAVQVRVLRQQRQPLERRWPFALFRSAALSRWLLPSHLCVTYQTCRWRCTRLRTSFRSWRAAPPTARRARPR